MSKKKPIADDKKLASKQDLHHDQLGREIPDPIPLQPPVGYKRAPSLAEQIRQQVAASKMLAEMAIQETEEEADDFDIGDDFDPHSPWENDTIPTLKEAKTRREKLEKELAEEEARASAPSKKKKETEEQTPE